MLKIFKKIFCRLLIYLACLTIALPASVILMMVSTPRAQAAEAPAKSNVTSDRGASKTKTIPETKTLLPSLKTSKGFSAQMTYHQGETIKVLFVFKGKVLRSWAEVGSLDSSFPATISLKNQGDGGWLLVVPKLSSSLNLGVQNLEIHAENARGTNVFSFQLSLMKREIKIIPKTMVSESEIRLFWQPIKNAQKYLVQWNTKGETVFHLKVVDIPKAVLGNLTSGTVYEIEITPIGQGGVLGEAQKMNLKTLGVAPVREIAGTQAKKGVTPAIGRGVTTAAPKIVQKEKPQAETPTQETAKPEEGKTGGWNRLLVALAILVIAAGAAIGGYYGYEWYAAKSADKEPPSGKSSNRW